MHVVVRETLTFTLQTSSGGKAWPGRHNRRNYTSPIERDLCLCRGSHVGTKVILNFMSIIIHDIGPAYKLNTQTLSWLGCLSKQKVEYCVAQIHKQVQSRRTGDRFSSQTQPLHKGE